MLEDKALAQALDHLSMVESRCNQTLITSVINPPHNADTGSICAVSDSIIPPSECRQTSTIRSITMVNNHWLVPSHYYELICKPVDFDIETVNTSTIIVLS